MKALTAAEMREVDRLTTERFGIPSLQLMEAAGKHVADVVVRELSPAAPKSVAVLCGKGNNGGDGLVAARYLKSSALETRVYVFGDPREMRGDAGANLARWLDGGNAVQAIENEAAWEKAWPGVADSQVIVDALLGTGLRGAATGLIAQVIEDINRLSSNATAARPSLILAVDTPSGLPSDGQCAEGPVLRAHRTVTFTAPKISQVISRDADTVGSLEVCAIGSPAALIEEIGQGTLSWAGPEEFAGLPLVRAVKSHKGTFGHVLLVAGSLGKSGAAILSGRGALRGGAGLVTIATPDVVLPIVAAAYPEYMTESLLSTDAGTASQKNIVDTPATPERMLTASPELRDRLMRETKFPFARIEEGKTVLAVGPGLGLHPETQDFIRTIVRQTYRPVILDADGLNAFAGRADELNDRKSKFLAITPHPGEMARLLESTSTAVQADRVAMALDAARRWNAHVVLKGYHSIVASPDGQAFVSTAGNAGLAKGGTGDVLTGLLAAMVAQFGTDDGARVLSLGVYLHGLAAEIASRGTDLSGLLAGEVADSVPHARLRLLEELRKSE
jgi:ADP-dependent NAD(P)H-hydrate dehydratase / NAD(P)H-hydrate epimerase